MTLAESKQWSVHQADGEKAYASGDFGESIKLFQAAVEEATTNHGESPELAACLISLAKAYAAQWQYLQSEETYKRALAILEIEPHRDVRQLVACLKDMAFMYQLQDDPGSAVPLYERALGLLCDPDTDQPKELVEVLDALSEAYRDTGRHSKSESCRVKLIELKQKMLGPEHPEIAVAMRDLAAMYEELGMFEKAEEALRPAFLIMRASFGPKDTRTMWCMKHLMEIQEKVRKKNELSKTDILWQG